MNHAFIECPHFNGFRDKEALLTKVVPKERIKHSLDLMASRIGSFPLAVATEAILDFGESSKIILDPFCGKGTTLTAARLLGKRALGIDASPEAVALSLAKIQKVSPTEIASYIRSLKIRRRKALDEDPRITVYFHQDTLGQILSIKGLLERDLSSSCAQKRKCAIFVRGILLGILHGHSNNSLSVSSSHSISFSPEYVRKYCIDNNLQAPIRDVKECLISHTHKVLADALPLDRGNRVVQGSAEQAGKIYSRYRGKIDLILTSPPYLHKQTYAKDNWLRLWFLGHTHQDVKKALIETASLPLYRKRMESCLLQFASLLRPGGTMILVTGTVRKSVKRKTKSYFEEINLGEEIASLCKGITGLKVVTTIEQNVMPNRRYFGALVNSTGHSPYDRVEQLVVVKKHA